MDNSEVLLANAMVALKEAGIQLEAWSVGGGTVLKNYFNHRISKDIDVFLTEPQLLSKLSPRLNNVTENALDYDEMSNYISLTYPQGKVDFIVASKVTEFDPKMDLFFNHWVYLEHPVEIVMKKLFFRGKKVLPRDLFDLAIVFNSNQRNVLIDAAIKHPIQILEFAESLNAISQNTDYVFYSEENQASLPLKSRKNTVTVASTITITEH